MELNDSSDWSRKGNFLPLARGSAGFSLDLARGIHT